MRGGSGIRSRSAHVRGAQNRKRGADCEQIIMNRLRAIGYAMVEKIETGMRANGSYIKKVSGDIRAIEQGSGRAVLCEVKHRPRKLVYSDLQAHQHESLQLAHDSGAIALLAWISSAGVYIMRYPICGFVPKKSLNDEQAALFCITNRGTKT